MQINSTIGIFLSVQTALTLALNALILKSALLVMRCLPFKNLMEYVLINAILLLKSGIQLQSNATL
jgi:hypothetical protein